LIPKNSGMRSFSSQTRTASSGVPIIISIVLVAVMRPLQSTASLGIMHIQCFVLSNTKASVLSSFATLGAIRNGMVLGRTDQESGLLNGFRHSPLWGTSSEMMGSLSWSVSLLLCHVFLVGLLMATTDNDFLANWERIDRTLLFDEAWVMSSEWLRVPTRPLPSAWAFGDVSCKCCNSHFMKLKLNSVHIQSQSHCPHLLSRSLSFHNSILGFSEKSPAVLNGRSILYYSGKDGTRQWGRRPIQNFIPVV
jgi:hypothetical protein